MPWWPVPTVVVPSPAKTFRYKKYTFDEMKDADLNKTTQGGWVAMLQHYLSLPGPRMPTTPTGF